VNPVVQAAVLALDVGTVAQIGSQAKISAPLRLWLASRKKPWSRWLYDLISCAFCSSVWLAAIGAGIFRPWLVGGWPPLEFGTTALAISGASMLQVLVIRKALKA
jgi:hypothetical protein